MKENKREFTAAILSYISGVSVIPGMALIIYGYNIAIIMLLLAIGIFLFDKKVKLIRNEVKSLSLSFWTVLIVTCSFSLSYSLFVTKKEALSSLVIIGLIYFFFLLFMSKNIIKSEF